MNAWANRRSRRGRIKRHLYEVPEIWRNPDAVEPNLDLFLMCIRV
jgi:hypothetical protein